MAAVLAAEHTARAEKRVDEPLALGRTERDGAGALESEVVVLAVDEAVGAVGRLAREGGLLESVLGGGLGDLALADYVCLEQAVLGGQALELGHWRSRAACHKVPLTAANSASSWF